MTEWIMVIITGIYVVATILICVFNYRSAKATRDQVAESRRQFEESNRAFVTVNFEIVRNGLAVLRIHNRGKRIANNVKIRISDEFVNNIPDFRDSIIKLNNSSFILGIEQSWYICMGSHIELEQMGKQIMHIDIMYSDSKSDYSQQLDIDLTQYFWSLIYNNAFSDLYSQAKETNKYLKSIESTLSRTKNYD